MKVGRSNQVFISPFVLAIFYKILHKFYFLISVGTFVSRISFEGEFYEQIRY